MIYSFRSFNAFILLALFCFSNFNAQAFGFSSKQTHVIVDNDEPTQTRTMVDDGEFVSKCFGCHGRSGVSGNGPFPNLAGQDVTYIFNQLKSFRDGEREDLTMNAMPFMVKGLSDADLNGLALIFNSYPRVKVDRNQMTDEDKIAYKEGEKLVNGERLICRFCHLTNHDKTEPTVPGYPVLTGQRRKYLINQIKAFRDEKRWSPIMNSDLVGDITDKEVEALATYFRFLGSQ